ncbi:MAG TPA: roadblock/LC7 domain-containing protein [Candidatus Thermoplasmatota archaeon]|nr:roadblock/LC7 domain-containing protein [Candidatus Thermoplasmatota archaeon]
MGDATEGFDLLPAQSPGEALSTELRESLAELQRNLGGLLGSVLVDDEGSPLAWDLRGGVDPALVATAGAMLARAGVRTTELMDLGRSRNVIVTTDRGSIAVFQVASGLALVTLLQPGTNNILVLVEVRKAIERLREVIARGV